MTLDLTRIEQKLAKFHPDLALEQFNRELRARGEGIFKILFDIAEDTEAHVGARLQAIEKIVELTGAREYLALGFEPLKEMLKRAVSTSNPSAEDSADESERVSRARAIVGGEPPPPRPKRSPGKPPDVRTPRDEGRGRKVREAG